MIMAHAKDAAAGITAHLQKLRARTFGILCIPASRCIKREEYPVWFTGEYLVGSLKISKLTKAALGQECTLQIQPYCTNNTETVVFCHFPSADHGMGIKSPPWWGADGCSACHDVIDSRNAQAIRHIGWEEIEKCKWRGLFRTMKRRIEQGLIKVPN